MKPSIKRRDFLKSTVALGATALATGRPSGACAQADAKGKPIVIASGNGMACTAKAMEMIRGGSDALDALDAVGEGALRFARMHGFEEENLLTDRGRKRWLKWRENLSATDDWLPPHDINSKDVGMIAKPIERDWGTINCNALDQAGNLSGCTTTSGLSFKIPGRVGDSPILGAGLFVDNEIGAAGSTGRGEANLSTCASVMVVEYMRDGKSPEQACLQACERIVRLNKMKRLQDKNGRPAFNVRFYAINKQGEYGSGEIWSGGTFTVNTGEKESRKLNAAYLFKRAK